MNKEEKQEFLNEITFYTKDVANADFFLLSKEVANIEIKDNNNIHIRSFNDQPSIIGFYYAKDEKSGYILNSYHTEDLMKKNYCNIIENSYYADVI